MEEIRNVTWGLWGVELKYWQIIQRLVNAGFHDPRVLLNMFAIIEGESGAFTKAWHANVMRTADEFKDIVYDTTGRMTINSIDLGFIQKNVTLNPVVKIMPTEEAMKEFVEGQFTKYPELALADKSAEIAWDMYNTKKANGTIRGYEPWYAYQPGTDKWKHKKRIGSKALADYLLKTQVGRIDGVVPELIWKDPKFR